MTVHEPTLMLALGLASLSASAVFFTLALLSREIPGVRFWAIGSLSAGLAQLLDGSGLVSHWQLLSLLFNIPFYCGLSFMLAGTMRFCQRPGARAALWLLCGLAVAVTVVFTFLVSDSRWRIAILDVHQGAVNVWMAAVLWRHAELCSRRTYRVASVVCLVEAAPALLQAMLAVVTSKHVTYGSPELPLSNIVLWACTYLNTLVGDALLFLLVALRLIDKLRLSAERDALTGLLNRRGMRNHFDGLLERLNGSLGSVGILMLDIDHFKAVNDTFGHETGDKVLAIMGEVLLRTQVQGSAPCRWGGEEFCIAVENPTREALLDYGEAIRREFFQATSRLPELPAGRTVSVGIATAGTAEGLDIPKLINAADAQLYAAKDGGRNRIAIG